MDRGNEGDAYGQTDGQTKGSVAHFGGRVLQRYWCVVGYFCLWQDLQQFLQDGTGRRSEGEKKVKMVSKSGK